MRLIFFGDVVGKAGRKAVAEVLPKWRAQYKPDVVAANIDNVAHGRGFTSKTVKEFLDLGIDILTGGDHVFDNTQANELLAVADMPILRPANFKAELPGVGYKIISVGSRQLLFIHLLGQVFITEELDSPFKVVDDLLSKNNNQGDLAGIFVDLHAEATSEKVAMGWYLDGRVTGLVGTHTHVATADEKVLPKGTAYISDLGMVGATESVIGVRIQDSLSHFLTNTPGKFEPVEQGEVVIGAAMIDFDPTTTKASAIVRLTDKVVLP